MRTLQGKNGRVKCPVILAQGNPEIFTDPPSQDIPALLVDIKID